MDDITLGLRLKDLIDSELWEVFPIFLDTLKQREIEIAMEGEEGPTTENAKVRHRLLTTLLDDVEDTIANALSVTAEQAEVK